MAYLIDDDVLRFLNGHLGNSDDNAFKRCSDFAYRDMCRTIRFKKEYVESKDKSAEERQEITQKKRDLRNQVTKLLQDQVEEWIACPPKDFDGDHTALCEQIISMYKNTTDQGQKEDSLYFGQAQKWVNMTLKNLYVYSKSNAPTGICLNNLLPLLHVPIDNVILDVASDKVKCYVDPPSMTYGVKKPTKAWSKWDENDYKTYQKELKARLSGQTPLLWELTHWSTVITE